MNLYINCKSKTKENVDGDIISLGLLQLVLDLPCGEHIKEGKQTRRFEWQAF